MPGEVKTTSSLASEMFPPKPHWTGDDIPDQTGKIAIVTGGNTGIGYETVLALLKKNAKVYLGARNEEKAKAAIEKLLAASKAPPANLVWLNLDLGELSKTRKGAEEFLSKEEKLDQLYCSAGVMAPALGSKTADGIEMQLGTNVIAHHFLIKLLLPALEKAAQAPGGKGNARICLTSSSGHHMHPGGFEKSDPEKKNSKAYQKGMAARWNLYGQSKRGNILDAKAWARRVGDKGIVVTSCNPGNLSTELSRHQTGFVKLLFSSIVKHTILFAPWYGSLTQLYANTSPEAAELNGKYLVPWARVGKENAESEREDQQEDLWNYCEEVISKY